jgi:hypothetical protein
VHANSVTTAARTSILGTFAAGKGHSADADYSLRAWLIHKTDVTGAAVAYTTWLRRAEAHPLVAGRLAAGEITVPRSRYCDQAAPPSRQRPDRASQ